MNDLTAKIDTLNTDRKKGFYLVTVTEINCGAEYEDKFLLQCEQDVDHDECINYVLLNYRGEGTESDDDGVTFGDNMSVHLSEMKPISPFEFAMLKPYIKENNSFQIAHN